jgi:hypothetical protein
MIKKILLASMVTTLMTTSSFAVEVLTQTQKDTLLFIYQEEKVARDVYITLGNLYPDQKVFQNIQLSEQEHIDSAQVLCEKYGVDISNVDETDIGVFVVPALQELYDTLVAQGSTSEADSLEVGEYIEITDIDDLEHAEIGMPTDVVEVYENLKAGSYSHLDAFRTAIKAYYR